MIEVLASLIGWEVFIHNLCADPEFSHPMLAGPEKFRKNLFASPENPEKCVLGVTRGGIKCGLFVFLVLKDENYLEMTAGLSRDEGAYRELAEYLEAAFAGFAADFVFNTFAVEPCGVDARLLVVCECDAYVFNLMFQSRLVNIAVSIDNAVTHTVKSDCTIHGARVDIDIS